MTLTLPHRRNLFAKMMTHEVFDHPSGDEVFDSVREEAIRLMSDEAKATLSADTAHRLDCFARRTSNFAVESIRRTPRLALCERSHQALENLGRQADAISCHNCASASKTKICDGSADDDLTVSKGGHCIAPLKTIIEASIEVARSYYVEFSPEFAALGDGPQVSWSLQHYAQGRGRSTPHHIPVPVFAGAETRFADGAYGLRSEVILNLVVDSFDFNTQESLPYITLHECMCHIFQGAGSGQLQRSVSPSFDLFSEGWIDGLVPQVFSEMRSGTGHRSQFRDVLARNGQVCAGLEMQSARGNSSRVPSSLFAGYVARARVAADAVRAALIERLGAEAGLKAFVQLSLDLNVVLGDTDRRNKLVDLVVFAGPNSGPDFHRVQKTLDNFAKDDDARNFISKIFE